MQNKPRKDSFLKLEGITNYFVTDQGKKKTLFPADQSLSVSCYIAGVNFNLRLALIG